MKQTRLWMLAAILILSGSLTVFGQRQQVSDKNSGIETDEQFTVATLNVDGLPQKVLIVKINADGPGEAGTARIGKYLLKKGYDLVLMQEDFNYHNVLSVFLEDDYNMDTWSGDVGLDGHTIDFLHLQNHRFECDGLMTCWKNDITMTTTARTAWQQNFGKFSHANDEMVTKGFRRYEMTLRGGQDIVVYNMHMDASDNEDEMAQNDAKDKEARIAQWIQLKDDILSQLDSRPIIIAGDMNSFYGCDNVKQEFIDAINGTGLATVSDVWVELQQQGVYPAALTPPINPVPMGMMESGETLDKILYINPVDGNKIQPVAFSVDRDGYQYDGKPLGDHYPLVATFSFDQSEKLVGIESLTTSTEGKGSIYTLGGVKVKHQMPKGLYIEQKGERVNKYIVK